ncbi:MAG: 30S ribosomal protein S9 [Crocinitomicaceae bacterium]|nr:30S ribosomal protein S9 [Crocinitomicaceae bacterium]|tara:strand:+ start:9962 stop:10348 length:387 start_codon:yes stop_codon:yes gene_type:complete
MSVVNALGRRKASVVRIYMNEGKGKITVNNKEYTEYFPQAEYQKAIVKPFELTENMGKFDVKVNARGGGVHGQADALKLAIARALVKVDEENRSVLRTEGCLTRDSRMVERKKPGQKKARKKFQFSKR